MIQRDELVQYTNTLLNIADFKDYCPNGLQVEGKPKIQKIITAVTASQFVIDTAVEQQADLLLVHHGFFWKGEDARVVGMKQKRLKQLLTHDINLLGYHLPLDAHPELGNNAQLAEKIGCPLRENLGAEKLVCWGELETPIKTDELTKRLETQLERTPMVISGGDHPIRKIGWCSGGAQDYFIHAKNLGVDAYITGEISERNYHEAREWGIHFFSAGHHATERYGVQALGTHLAEKFGLDYSYIEEPNPV